MATQYGCQVKFKTMQVREATGCIATDAKDFVRMFEDSRELSQEAFFVVTMNQKHKVIDKHLVSLGTLTASLVHPREVFRPALIDGAAAVAFIHNHPSGDCTPSPEDRSLTERLCKCGKLLGLRVLDHVILGKDCFFSFQEAGVIC